MRTAATKQLLLYKAVGSFGSH